MSFGFGTSGNTMAGNATGGAAASEGPELELIQTEGLGFKSIGNGAKVRLTTPWEQPPPNTSSLITIAPRKGLVAAAGPDGISLATTASVRQAFESDKQGDSDVRSFEPQRKLPLPMRVSHITFTADETYLILSAESGGGLAAYEIDSLLQGNTQCAFELGTNGETLRALVPNPTTEKAELCALVTNNGNLHMANLKEKQLGNPLKTQVSCISWSTKGKQLVAGLADGTIHQMTPEGEGKGDIPRPPSIPNAHVASVSWLENHLFLIIHTTNESPPSSVYHMVQRSGTNFTYQKMTDPVDPFGAEKAPHYSFLRLKDFAPNLQDLLIVSSTVSPDIGLLTRSKTPLTSDKPADSVTNVFTTTELLDDSKRAQLPMSDSMDNTIPIGVALDLSSKDKVYRPLPEDEELEDSPGPLPGYWVLNHEGILCAWWVIYEESIRQGTTYAGITAGNTAMPGTTSAPTPAVSSTPAFGNSAGSSGFGAGSGAAPTFGGAPALGSKPSPWGAPQPSTGGQTQSAFGTSSFGSTAATSSPAFGKPSAIGFGQSSQLGGKSSPWGAAGAGGSAPSSGTPAFGQSAFAGANSGAPAFGSSTGSSGFASLGANNNSGGSIFANKSSSSAFGTTEESSSTAFPAPKSSNTGGVFGSSQPFKLQSSFKADPATKDDNEKPSAESGSSLFGSKFGSALGDAAKQEPTKDQDMDTTSTPQEPTTKSPFSTNGQSSQTQAPSESKSPFGSGGQAPPAKSPFSLGGQPSQTTTGKSPFSLGNNQSNEPAKPSPFSGAASQTPPAKSPFSLGGTGQTSQLKNPFSQGSADSQSKSVFGQSPSTDSQPKSPFGQASTGGSQLKSPFSQTPTQTSQPKSPFSLGEPQSTTPTTTPAPSRFFTSTTDASATPKGGLSLGATKTPEPAKDTPQIKVEEEDAPLPPESTSKNTYPLGESSSSSAATDGGKAVAKPESAPLPPDFAPTPKPSQSVAEDAPLPPDFTSTPKAAPPAENKAKTSDFFKYEPVEDSSDDESLDDSEVEKAKQQKNKPAIKRISVKKTSTAPALPESEGETDREAEDAESEGSGVMVGKDISPTTSGVAATPGYTPQSSFGGMTESNFTVTDTPQERPRASLFGDVSRNAPVFPRPNVTSPRSPSPVRHAVPNRLTQPVSRSVSAPGMASQILGASQRQSQSSSLAATASRVEEDPQLKAQRLARSKREAEETKVLEDEEDDEIQKILASDIEPKLQLDDFIAHTNTVPSSQETIPSQVEAVYRDINSMTDTLGLNARSLAGFVKGHMQSYKEGGRSKDDLENADDWVLCEVNELGEVIDRELARDLADGRVHDVEGKLEVCQELSRDMSRLRTKQEDLKKLITIRLDPDQADMSRSLPLSTEQAAQQNELRREYAKFSKHLAEAEEALTLLKTKLASLASASGRGGANVPTVEAVIRTITKLTSMAEKKSGDVDVLENQMRKLRFSSVNSREGSPSVTTPQRNNRSVMFSPDQLNGSPRNNRNSLMSSITSASGKNTTPRKKVSGYNAEEKKALMEKRAKRQAVLQKLKANVEKNGVQPWAMPEDTE